jgi:hypothetical protein
VISAFSTVQTVYALNDLEDRVSKRLATDSPSVWHTRDILELFKREVSDTLQAEASRLARAFYDYIALTAAGEARHADYACTHRWKDWPTHSWYRNTAYCRVEKYNPDDVLRAAVELFSQGWASSYGGKRWRKIAEVGLLYGKVSDLVFLDMAVDLSHNGGLFLDKGVIFTMPNRNRYRRVLDYKTSHGLLSYRETSVHRRVRNIIDLGRQLGLHEVLPKVSRNPSYDNYLISWGGTRFRPELIRTGRQP